MICFPTNDGKGRRPALLPKYKEARGHPLKEYAAFPIEVFEDDESLHFPEEEAPEVEEV